MLSHLIASILLASNATGKTLVRTQPGTAVPVAGASVLSYLPFTAPGCYPSGTLLGTRGEALTFVRSTTKTCPIAAGEQTCAVNQACVTEQGLLLEFARTQRHPSPSAPASGSVTFAATGAHVFWVVGSGSQQLSASGTLVATGLPCTATAASPCAFTVTTLGATPTGSLGAVTGSLSRAQIEAGAYATSFIPSGSRGADIASISNPMAGINPAVWCMDVTVTPQGGRSWNATEGGFYSTIWADGTLGSANSAYLSGRYFGVYNAGSSQKYIDYNSMPPSSAPHRVQAENISGAMRLIVDGATQALSTAGSDGLIASQPSTLYVGVMAANGNGPLGGYVQHLRVSRTACR